MEIILSEAQQALYAEGFYEAQHVEQDCLDLAAQYDPSSPVVVTTIDGRVLFALTPYQR